MEKHVVSLELSKRLKKLGVKQKSCFFWNFNEYAPEQGWYFDDENLAYKKEHTVSAFISCEIGKILPAQIDQDNYLVIEKHLECGDWYTSYQSIEGDLYGSPTNQAYLSADTMPESMGKMLEYLLENKIITI